MNLKYEELIYIKDDTSSIGKIKYDYNFELSEILFELRIKGVLDSREHSIEELKKELEEVLKKYLI